MASEYSYIIQRAAPSPTGYSWIDETTILVLNPDVRLEIEQEIQAELARVIARQGQVLIRAKATMPDGSTRYIWPEEAAHG